jgi:biotin synthase
LATADRVRRNDVGNEIHLRASSNFPISCERDCLYCGLRRANERLERYRMSDEEILAAAEDVKAAGIATVVLQSGEDAFYDVSKICLLVERIKRKQILSSRFLSEKGRRPITGPFSMRA